MFTGQQWSIVAQAITSCRLSLFQFRSVSWTVY